VKRLITGASGFIGGYLARHLKEKFPNDTLQELGRDAGDISDPAKTKKAIQDFSPDQIYHLAGRAQVNDQLGIPDYFPRNFLTTISVLDSAITLEKPVRLFFSSSIQVYGKRDGIVDEKMDPEPSNAYGFTKFLAEEALRTYSQNYPLLMVAIARLSNCIGPGQSGGFVAADLSQKIAQLPADNSKPLEVGPLSGVRPFLDVRDAVQLFPKLLGLLSKDRRYEIFNVASPTKTPISEVLELLLEISGKSPKVNSASSPQNQFAGFSVSTEKLTKMVPHPSFRPIRDSLKDMYQFQLTAHN
jgi:GDP-4-dehydro-6-deoxy-D-mannose reductase